MKRKLLTLLLTSMMVVGLSAGSLSAGEFGTINITAESGSNIVINNYYGDQAAPEGAAAESGSEEAATEGEAAQAPTVKKLSFTPGTYTGTSENGKNGTVTVTATLSEDRIESIETEHQEDADAGVPGGGDPHRPVPRGRR